MMDIFLFTGWLTTLQTTLNSATFPLLFQYSLARRGQQTSLFARSQECDKYVSETSKAAEPAAASKASITCLEAEVCLSGNIDSFWPDDCLKEFVNSTDSCHWYVRLLAAWWIRFKSYPDFFHFPWLSLLTLEFPDFSRFSRWVVTLSSPNQQLFDWMTAQRATQL